jgi:vancomycin resistance protein YoaR
LSELASSPDGTLSELASSPDGGYRTALVAGVICALAAGIYVTDLVSGNGSAARAVVVAGVPVGGLPLPEAERVLRVELEPRAARPVPVSVGELRGDLERKATGLRIDWPATLDRVADQPLNPVTRIAGLFTDREVEPVSRVDEELTTSPLERLAQLTERPPTEASIRFVGTTPTAVEPAGGRRLDLPGAIAAIERYWLGGAPVQLPVVEVPAAISSADLHRTVDTIAVPAVSGPVAVLGEGVRATLTPEVIAGALRFRAAPEVAVEGRPGLVPELNTERLTAAVRARLAPSERRGRGASVSFAGGAPRVVAGQDGRRIDYPATFAGLPEVLTRTGAREITAVYAGETEKVTVEQLNAVLAAGEVSSFSTGGFAADSGQNIRRAAELVNGTVIGPGETFSLNGLTNPRDASNGFVGRHHP